MSKEIHVFVFVFHKCCIYETSYWLQSKGIFQGFRCENKSIDWIFPVHSASRAWVTRAFIILMVFLHGWFIPVSGPSAAGRRMWLLFRRRLSTLPGTTCGRSSGMWHKTGPLALCALLLLGGRSGRSTDSPFAPTTVIHHACTNTLSEY